MGFAGGLHHFSVEREKRKETPFKRKDVLFTLIETMKHGGKGAF